MTSFLKIEYIESEHKSNVSAKTYLTSYRKSCRGRQTVWFMLRLVYPGTGNYTSPARHENGVLWTGRPHVWLNTPQIVTLKSCIMWYRSSQNVRHTLYLLSYFVYNICNFFPGSSNLYCGLECTRYQKRSRINSWELFPSLTYRTKQRNMSCNN